MPTHSVHRIVPYDWCVCSISPTFWFTLLRHTTLKFAADRRHFGVGIPLAVALPPCPVWAALWAAPWAAWHRLPAASGTLHPIYPDPEAEAEGWGAGGGRAGQGVDRRVATQGESLKARGEPHHKAPHTPPKTKEGEMVVPRHPGHGGHDSGKAGPRKSRRCVSRIISLRMYELEASSPFFSVRSYIA